MFISYMGKSKLEWYCWISPFPDSCVFCRVGCAHLRQRYVVGTAHPTIRYYCRVRVSFPTSQPPGFSTSQVELLRLQLIRNTIIIICQVSADLAAQVTLVDIVGPPGRESKIFLCEFE